MNNRLLSILSFAAVMFFPTLLPAQNPIPHWASIIFNTASNMSPSSTNFATDKQGNIYVLASASSGGYMNADGQQQATTNADATTVLVSWDCHQNLRWMKTFGGANYNQGVFLHADSLGGIYISGGVRPNAIAGHTYWDADTTINLAANNWLNYIVKYDTNGQFQWLRTPTFATDTGVTNHAPQFSVSPSGEVFWFELLEPGSYNGGSFSISTRRYYAVQYDASGNYQSVTPLDMSPPAPGIVSHTLFYFEPVANRFYAYLTHQPSYGILTIGATAIVSPSTSNPRTAVLAAFNRQGANLWVQQGGTAKNTHRGDHPTSGKDGTLFLTRSGDAGSVFCGDTATNLFAPSTYGILALDTNAHVLWSSYINYRSGQSGLRISTEGNTVAVTGTYSDTLSVGNNTIINPNLSSQKGYLLLLNAANGTVAQLDTIHSTPIPNHPSINLFTTPVLDRNGNIYLSGSSFDSIYFANNTLSSYTFGNNGRKYHFLLKYKNVNCNCDLLQPAFVITGSLLSTYQFSYTGQTPYTALSWDFGDGSPVASGANPSHTYMSTGVFPVCVTATNSCGSNTMCTRVTVEEVSHVIMNTDAFGRVRLYPNPARDRLTVSNLEPGTTVEVWDAIGRNIKKEIAGRGDVHIPVERLHAGIYLIRFTDKEGNRGGRMFVKE